MIKQNIDLVINPMAKERQALRNSVMVEAEAFAEATKATKAAKAAPSHRPKRAVAAAAAAASGDMEDL